MKIIVIHSGSDDNPRACKIVKSLSLIDNDILFVGWDRGDTRNKREIVPATTIKMFSKKVAENKKNIFAYLSYFLFVYKIFKEYNPDVVHCINEEMAAIVLPLKGIKFRFLVTDIFDTLTERVEKKNIIFILLLKCVSRLVYKYSDNIIVCDERRFQRLKSGKTKAVIIENTPVDPGPSLSMSLPENEITISMIGNITKKHGVDVVLLALAKNVNIRLIVAGILDVYTKKLFLNHPQVNYQGIITPKESLEVIASSDALLSLYEPSTLNHIYASPSKIFDSMSVGRPVIINEETAVSKWINENKLGYVVPYNDLESLSSVFRKIAKSRSVLYKFAKYSRNIYVNNHTWREMEKRLLMLYNNLNNNQ